MGSDGTFTGSRPRNMFYMTAIGSSTRYYLPNPDYNDGLKSTIATMVNSARNTKAVVTAQKIGRDQIKHELSWNFLSVDEWEPLLGFWDKHFFFNLHYYDPVAGGEISRKCYISDRPYSYYDIRTTNGLAVPTAYINCSASIVDTGA